MITENLNDYKGIMLYGRIDRNGPSECFLELLGEANRLREQMAEKPLIIAACLGNTIEPYIEKLIHFGANHVSYIEDPRLREYRPDLYTDGLVAIIRRNKPEIVLVCAEYEGAEMASAAAARLGTGLAAHCVQMRFSENEFIQVVPAFSGKILGDILCPQTRPQMSTIKPGMFSKMEEDPTLTGTSEKLALETNGFGDQIKIISSEIPQSPKYKSINNSDFVIAGGLGVGSREDWQILEKLADLTGGAVGSTRPALDLNWTDDEKSMIGTSGSVIRPKLYISVGISGAAHHTCGIKEAGLSIAINNDSEASIFSESDFGICEDWKNIIPLLIEKIEKGKEN